MLIGCLVSGGNARLPDRLREALPEHDFVAGMTLGDLGERIATMTALVVNSPLYTAEVLSGLSQRAARLDWIQCLSSGADHLVEIGLPPGVVLTTASGAHANGVAEHAAALILSTLRRLPDLERARARNEWAKALDGLGTLEASRVAIIGFGHIGQALARRLRAFGAVVTGVNRSGTPHADADAMLAVGDFADAARSFDIVALCLPGTAATADLVDAAMIARFRPGAILVNVGRGNAVDEDAILAALDAGQLGHYATDVTRTEPLPAGHPFWRHERVTFTPHLSGRNPQLLSHLTRIVGENIRNRAAGRPLLNVLDAARTA